MAEDYSKKEEQLQQRLEKLKALERELKEKEKAVRAKEKSLKEKDKAKKQMVLRLSSTLCSLGRGGLPLHQRAGGIPAQRMCKEAQRRMMSGSWING